MSTARRSSFLKVTAACVPLTLLAVVAAAQGQPGSAPAAQPAAAPDSAAKAVIERARKAYGSLKTYQDTMKLEFVMKGKRGTEALDENQDEETQFAYAAASAATGRSFSLTVADDFRVVSDGKVVTTVMPSMKEYTQKELPANGQITWSEIAGPAGEMILMSHPVAGALLKTPGKEATEKFAGLEEYDAAVKAEEFNGQPGKTVAGKTTFAGFGEPKMVPATYWFSDETGLIGRITIDMTPAYREMIQGMMDSMPEEMKAQMGEDAKMTVDQAGLTLVVADMVLDAEIKPALLAFKPGAEDKKVEEFSMGGGGGDEDAVDPGKVAQQALVGSEAPEFSGTALDGQPISLKDLRGKIVVLDFWATWCGPCRIAIPHIQQISTDYADKGVVVVGMNHDGPKDIEKIKKFMGEKRITFRQFLDHDNKVGDAYHVSGIPCTVLIDKKGIVQSIHVGFGPGGEAKYREELDKLVKGENLFQPKADPGKPDAPKGG